VLFISDFARSVQILVEIAGNPEAKLDAINKKVDGLSSKKVDMGGSHAATNQMNQLAGSTQKVEGAVASAGQRMTTAFSGVKSSLSELQGSIQGMMGSLAGIAIGGSIAGLSWLSAAKSKLYNEQIETSINANKKLGVSYQMLTEEVKKHVAAGEGTTGELTKEMYSIMTMGSKFVGKGSTALANAKAIGDFWYSRKESMQEQGISDPEQLVQRAIRTQGKMSGRMAASFALAVGVSPDDASMKTAKGRMKLFMQSGAKVDMGVELDKRPWDLAETRMKALKKAIGDSLGGPMAVLTSGFASFLELVTKIPFGPAIIGWSAAGLALASALSLVIGVMTPLWGVMKAVNAATGIGAALNWIFVGSKTAQTTATLASTTASVMATGAMEGEFLATEMTTYATNMSFGARLRLIGAKVWDTATSWANTAANWLGVSSLLGVFAASTTASSGFSLLAVATNLAAAPLWVFIGAGLVLVAVFGAILAKAGILKPILDGISKIKWGKVFGDLVEGDFSGAWKKLTSGFQLPSLNEAFKNLFGGTSIVAVLNKTFGIPLNTMIKWLDSIHGVMKIATDFLSSVWNTLKSIWTGLLKIIPGAEKAFTQGKINLLADKKGLNFDSSAGEFKDKAGNIVKDPGTKLTELRDLWKGQTGFFEGIANALKGIIPKSVQTTITNTYEASQSPADSEQGKTFSSAFDQGVDSEGVAWESATDFGILGKALGLGSADSGGLVTKSGLLMVHANEPIIPAQIAKSSTLLNLLENIAQGPVSSTSSKGGDINIYMTYSGGSNGNGIYLDKFAFEREVKNIIGKCTRNYGSY
jgi:hypothetical protein